MDYCEPDYISGLSILGGEPFCNLDITLKCAQVLRQCFVIPNRYGYGQDFYMNI